MQLVDRITVRPMQEGDVKQLARLEQDIFTDPWSEQNLLDLLGKDYCLYYVAVYEEMIIGFAGLVRMDTEADIDRVMVKKDFRGKGVSSILMGKILDEGTQLGVRDFTLEVRAGNEAAIGLYSKFGFQSEGIRPRFYSKPTEDALIMWRRQA